MSIVRRPVGISRLSLPLTQRPQHPGADLEPLWSLDPLDLDPVAKKDASHGERAAPVEGDVLKVLSVLVDMNFPHRTRLPPTERRALT